MNYSKIFSDNSILTVIIGVFIVVITPQNAAAKSLNADEDHNVIVVMGDRERKKKVHKFIKSAINESNSQYARFNASICPIALGFNDEYNEVIENRMRAVTKAADVRTGEDGCRPNMVVVVVKGPQEFIGIVRKKHPNAFGDMSIPARDRIMAGPGPAYLWNATYNVSSSGSRNSSPGGATGSASNSLDGFGSFSGSPSFAGSASRIKVSVVQDISLAVLVLEKTAMLDLSLRQIADYAVMRLLANTDEPSKQEVSERSILTLFSYNAERSEQPQSVTAWDLALLKSLYKTKNNVSSSMQRSAMVRIFETELLEIASETDDN